MYVDMEFITKTNKNNQKELRELNVVDSGLMWRGDVTKDYYSSLETCLCSLVLQAYTGSCYVLLENILNRFDFMLQSQVICD